MCVRATVLPLFFDPYLITVLFSIPPRYYGNVLEQGFPFAFHPRELRLFDLDKRSDAEFSQKGFETPFRHRTVDEDRKITIFILGRSSFLRRGTQSVSVCNQSVLALVVLEEVCV